MELRTCHKVVHSVPVCVVLKYGCTINQKEAAVFFDKSKNETNSIILKSSSAAEMFSAAAPVLQRCKKTCSDLNKCHISENANML